MYPDNENTFYINITHYLNDVAGNVLSIYTDYYPHGSIMPGRHFTSSTQYRYDYQGQEKDQETNWNNFELRMYDANLGRWMSPDPYGEFFSPYLAMGNNPVSMVDPDGGKVMRSGTGAAFDVDYQGRERKVDPFDMVGGGGTREEHYLKTKDGNLISLDEEGPYSVGEQLRGFGYYAAGTGSTAQSTQISTYNFNVYVKGSDEVQGSFTASFDKDGKLISETSFSSTVGNAQSRSYNFNPTNTIIGAIGFGNDIKNELISYAGNGNKLSSSVAKYLKVSRGLGIAGSVITTGYSASLIYDQYQQGGVNEVFQHRDVLDAGVGAVGLGATALATFGLISNPVGWAISAGVLIYGGTTLIYDAYNKPKK